MGMTIEENIATLKEHLNTLNVDKGVEFYQEIESIQLAIDIMRKYQKIQEIVQSKTTRLSYDIGFSQIKKVVEDATN